MVSEAKEEINQYRNYLLDEVKNVCGRDYFLRKRVIKEADRFRDPTEKTENEFTEFFLMVDVTPEFTMVHFIKIFEVF